MGYVVAILVAFAALAVGLAVGWFGHRRVWTWCERCTRPMGTLCVDCRDHERRANRARLGADAGKPRSQARDSAGGLRPQARGGALPQWRSS